MRIIYIEGMHGLGDNIFCRSIIRDYLRQGWVIWYETPWPNLFFDLCNQYPGQLEFVRCHTALRTQKKNFEKYDAKLAFITRSQISSRQFTAGVKITYGSRDLRARPIYQTLTQILPLKFEPVFDLPPYVRPSIIRDYPPYVVVRPVTARSEWRADARSPDPQYITQAVDIFRGLGYKIISIADIWPGNEWFVGDPPEADLKLHNGELSIQDTLAIVRHAACAIGGVGWIVPAAIHYGTPLLCILGGLGMHNAPEKITDPRMDLTKTKFIYPDNFCKDCEWMQHACDKFVGGFEGQVSGFIEEQDLRDPENQKSRVDARVGLGVLPGSGAGGDSI